MAKLTIDGRTIQTEKKTVLEAAMEAKVRIPTLCHDEALSPYGACRLCVVEIRSGDKTQLVSSCTYPALDGLEVRTNSDRVTKARRMVVELLLARSPGAKVLRELAAEFGIEEPRFKKEDEDCILCGRCVRACAEIVGANAISFIGRGASREVETPFRKESNKCIECGLCAFVCPTEAIRLEEAGKVRRIERWHASKEMQQCKVCGRYFAPKAQLDFVAEKSGVPRETLEICETCRQM